jgi:uncharacterized SAM-binding protein YcdF (DUF218 family)
MNSAIKRTNNTVVPEGEELRIVLEREAKRAVPEDKLTIHYPHFETIIALLEHFGFSSNNFTDDTLDIYEVLARGKKLVDELSQKILNQDLSNREIILLDDVYDYLTEEDHPEKSDLIIVLGGKTLLRAEKAGELYLKGLAKKVLVSGSRPIYGNPDEKTEAEKYKEVLLRNGVKEKDILYEDQSISMVDNVRRSLNMLDEIGFSFDSLIVVTSAYCQRRSWVLFKKLLPDSITLYRVNSEVTEPYKKNNWYTREDTLKVVLNEFLKMRASVIYNSA